MTFRLKPPYQVDEIIVTATTMNHPPLPAVTLEVEGERVHLSPDNARRIATALLAHAATAERTTGLSEWP